MTQRNLVLDQTKGVLIFLVVLGHFANWQQELCMCGGAYSACNQLLSAFYNAILSFHMPTFILISGYFSKSIMNIRFKEFDAILYPFVVIQIIDILLARYTDFGYSHGGNILYPIYQNWYILALFFWRLLLPICNKIPKKVMLGISVVVVFLSGFIFVSVQSGLFLAIYRTLYFLPFFLMGAYLPDFNRIGEQLEKYKVYAIVLFVISFIVIFALSIGKYYSYIWYAYVPQGGFSKLGWNYIIRHMGFISSFFIMLSFLTICYSYFSKHSYAFLSLLGKNTMPIYLFHGIIIFIVVPCIILKVGMLMNTLLCVIFSMLICWFFSRERVGYILSPLMKLSSLFGLFQKKYRE